jgi:hypothetical protein
MPIDIDLLTESELIGLNHVSSRASNSCGSLLRIQRCSSSELASGSPLTSPLFMNCR